MQFLLCYPRISPTVNTVGDKKSVPVIDSPAHQIEACLGPNPGFLLKSIYPDPRRRRPSAPPKKVMAPSSSIFPPLYFHRHRTRTLRHIQQGPSSPKEWLLSMGLGRRAKSHWSRSEFSWPRTSHACMNESRGSRSDIRTVFFRSTLCSN
jgi:hypothetical protein